MARDTSYDDFNKRYENEINSIADKHGVDLSVARNMFQNDVLQSGNEGYNSYGGTPVNEGMKKSYGEAYDNNINALGNEYGSLSAMEKDSDRGNIYLDAINRYINGGSSGNPNLNPNMQNSAGGYSYQGNGGLFDLQNFFKQNSEDYYNSQKAQFDSMLEQQLTSLESAYADAIANGEISVRDAQAQFEAQKKEIQKAAFEQSQANKLYGNDMGIKHSEQMVGIQQGANARENSLNNANATDRDKRILDIKSRINALKTKKDLDIASAQSQHGYNLAGASAQASQMYNQSMSDLLSKDYFSQQQQQFAKENMEIQQGYAQDNMGLQQEYAKELSEFQNNLDISKMWIGHEINLKEFDKQLENQFKIIDKNFSNERTMEGIRTSNRISEISAQAQAQAKMAEDEYRVALEREARKLGLNPKTATEADIFNKQRELGREDALQAEKDKRDSVLLDAMAMAANQYTIDSVFNNPALDYDPKKPKIMGPYSNAYKTWKKQVEEKSGAENAIIRFLQDNGMSDYSKYFIK